MRIAEAARGTGPTTAGRPVASAEHYRSDPSSPSARRAAKEEEACQPLPLRAAATDGTERSVVRRGLWGLSRLSAWWLRLDIAHERTQPGHPEQNGRHERMHRTLKQETTRPPASSFAAQQRTFDSFKREYNYERPHE